MEKLAIFISIIRIVVIGVAFIFLVCPLAISYVGNVDCEKFLDMLFKIFYILNSIIAISKSSKQPSKNR